jgi:hypothetical protein
MKIIVKEKGKTIVRLWFPNALVFSNFAARMATRKLNKKLPDDAGVGITSMKIDVDHKEGKHFSYKGFLGHLPEDKMKDAMRIFRQMRKDFPGVPLVDVQSSDGTYVLVEL